MKPAVLGPLRTELVRTERASDVSIPVKYEELLAGFMAETMTGAGGGAGVTALGGACGVASRLGTADIAGGEPGGGKSSLRRSFISSDAGACSAAFRCFRRRKTTKTVNASSVMIRTGIMTAAKMSPRGGPPPDGSSPSPSPLPGPGVFVTAPLPSLKPPIPVAVMTAPFEYPPELGNVVHDVLSDVLAEFVPDADADAGGIADVYTGPLNAADEPDCGPVLVATVGSSEAVVGCVMPINAEVVAAAVCGWGTESWPSVPWRASGAS